MGLILCMVFRVFISLFLLFIATPCFGLEPLPGRESDVGFVLEDNELYQNHFQGIRIRGSIPVRIKNCTFHSNGRGGIALERDSQVKITGCNLFQNGMAGINLDEAGDTVVENNRIFKNKMAGIRVWRSGKPEAFVSSVKIANNRIYSNDQAGIRSMPQGSSRVEVLAIGNEIFNNDKAGIVVENNTRLTARGNSIYENGTAGIMTYQSKVPPELDVYQNDVSFNRGVGIHILNGRTGDIGIRNNWIYNNQRSGILCALWDVPNVGSVDAEIINNTIVANGSADQGAGIRSDSDGKVVIMNNIVAFNYVSGIMTKGCKRYSHNLIFANGRVGNCCEDPHTAPYWIESLQLGGCQKRGDGDLITDPMFVDPDNYDFSLRDGSPAIDAGDEYDDISMPPSQGTSKNDMGATGGPYAITQRGVMAKHEAQHAVKLCANPKQKTPFDD